MSSTRDRAAAELAASGKQPKSRSTSRITRLDLVASDVVAVTHDEVEGMGL
ncbi:MAG: hypothetical protein QOH69_1445 [Actinomycetota bacterium]|jgi:hypothetical protein|nr:hypothetical protein [Actinomycetota bacterium]MDT5133142.1 hypothetical protein [Mycobacterium sp.]